MYNTIQKTIAAWAFNHYIAYYYFDNVNVSQLKVAFEKGEVELENLPIKKDALQHFNLSMDVVSGIVGRLSIKVPLMTLLTEPWIIKISNLMLIVSPKKQTNNSDFPTGATSNGNATTTSMKNETSIISNHEQSHLDLTQDTSDANLTDYIDNSHLEYELDDVVNSEENKLAEFYSSFSATVSSIVKDIYKNIRLEVESMTILFEDFEHGLARLSVESLLLHRPKSVRNLMMSNISIYLAHVGSTTNHSEDEELILLSSEKCNLNIFDEASNNMQLVVVEQPTPDVPNQSSSSTPATTSEIKIEGNFEAVTIEQLKRSDNKNSEKYNSSSSAPSSKKDVDGALLKRNILRSDIIKLEFKINNNTDEALNKFSEKNLHIKLDLIGMQYIHSQQIYNITKQCLKNLLKFIIKLQSKPTKFNCKTETSHMKQHTSLTGKTSAKKREESNLNKLMIINIDDGLVYVVDDTSGSCAIPILEFSLRDCRILQFSGKHQQNGLVYAKVGCNYYNREVSTWDTLLQPWPFSLSWDHKTQNVTNNRNGLQVREIFLNSDELAEFELTSAFLDLGDVALKRLIDDFMHPKTIARSLFLNKQSLSQEFNSIFVLHNETGHKLQFAPVELNFDMMDSPDSSRASPVSEVGGDFFNNSLMHKLSLNSRSSAGSRDSPDLYSLAKWISVDVGEITSFEYETLPIYRRHISDRNAKSRVLLLRVEGWKTLAPLSIDKTGTFFREACSDRVMNEDTHIVISIDLEEASARKVISIRSPLNLVNLLDATLEVHFVESNQALYIKPDSHLAVPLPLLYNQMHVRPCSVGVTMSDQPLLWDDIKQITLFDSKIHICHPITITDKRHASYCTSQPYRICVSTQRNSLQYDKETSDQVPSYSLLPAFSISFIPPLTIVNLLPCKIQYFIGDIEGNLSVGGQQRVYYVDTTKPADINFKMHGYPQSKAINIDPGATGSFHHTLEMFDKKNRSLYLNTKIIFASEGEEPAVKVIIYAPFWFINKTRLPLIFKQEGAVLEAAGQYRENEESPVSILLFSFYDTELEPPWLCSMRLGKSKGLSTFCDGFKLEKGTGERRLCFVANGINGDTSTSKSLIDINIRRGFGRYSQTMIVTFTARYGYDPLTKTPKKLSVPSPQNYRLASYNHNVNLSERIADHAINLFNSHQRRMTSDININLPGFNLTLLDENHDKLIEASVENIILKCTTKSKEQVLDCSIQDIRINNVASDCEKSVMLDRASSQNDESINVKPVVRLIMDRILGNSFGTTLFRQVQLSMCELVLNIEEKLILKLVEFISFRNRRKRKNMDNLSHDIDKILNPEEDRMAKYYFDLLRIDLSSLKLSVFTSVNLNHSLQKLKSVLGLKFFSFEDAQVQLSPYFKMNVSRTFRGIFDSVTRFYRRQILEQAPRIVGQQIQNYLRFHMSDFLSTLYDEVYHKLFI